MSDFIESLLDGAGYDTVKGFDETVAAIERLSDGGARLCSGYGVFPGGEKCDGCADCEKVDQDGE